MQKWEEPLVNEGLEVFYIDLALFKVYHGVY